MGNLIQLINTVNKVNQEIRNTKPCGCWVGLVFQSV